MLGIAPESPASGARFVSPFFGICDTGIGEIADVLFGQFAELLLC